MTVEVTVYSDQAKTIVRTDYQDDITIQIYNSPGGNLSGTLTVAAVNGVATFTDLLLDNVGADYSLLASAANTNLSVISSSFNMLPLALDFLAQPQNLIHTSLLAAVNIVFYKDIGKTIVDTEFIGPVTIDLYFSSNGGVLTGTLNVNAVAGVATFSDLAITASGTYGLQITATDLNLPSLFSDLFSTSSIIVFTVQPTDTDFERHITPAVTLAVYFDLANTLLDLTPPGTFLIALHDNPNGAVLSGGSGSHSFFAGLCALPNLQLDRIGAGPYTFEVTSTWSPTAISDGFVSTPLAIDFTVHPPSNLPFASNDTFMYTNPNITPDIKITAYKDLAKTIVDTNFNHPVYLYSNIDHLGTATDNYTLLNPGGWQPIFFKDRVIPAFGGGGGIGAILSRDTVAGVFYHTPATVTAISGVATFQNSDIVNLVTDGIQLQSVIRNVSNTDILSATSNSFNITGTRALGNTPNPVSLSPLTGIASNRTQGIYSIWVYGPTGSSNILQIGGNLFIYVDGSNNTTTTNNRLHIQLFGVTSGTFQRTWALPVQTLLPYTDPGAPLAAWGQWNHYLLAWNMSLGAGLNTCSLVLNGNLISPFSTPLNQNLVGGIGRLTSGTFQIANLGSLTGYDCFLAEVYTNFDATLDISDATNVQKFRTIAGKAANLGVNGSTPTGAQPSVYLTMQPTDPTITFFSNKGYSGPFNTTFPPSYIVGPISRAPTDPFM